MAEKQLVDGISDFSGGMDTSRASFAIGQNQYALGVNVDIPPTHGGLSNRKGFRNIFVEFESPKTEEIYRTGNIQGEGWYFDGFKPRYLVSVDGWIFEFFFVTKYRMEARIRNTSFRNNPNNTHCWISRVPNGAIVMDGESAALYITRNNIVRSNPKKKQIGSGRGGAWVQNRFWYIKDDCRNIWATTINDPLDLTEAYDANIFGFMVPDEDYLTAIGRNKTIARDALGGNLAFSSIKDLYSADVRGDRANWGRFAGSGVGFVDNSVPDLGAVSPYSFESLNGNIYFRNHNYGLLSSKQAQYQFTNLDSYFSHSIEANLFFERDSNILLSKCYTRGYRSKLYTTVAPEVKGKYTYWNGLVVYAPDIYYSAQEKAPRRYESVYTGIRPWCVTVSDTEREGALMLIHSYDFDGVNRVYVYDESLDYDIDKDFKKKEIESKFLTRAFSHSASATPKQTDKAFYSLKDIPRDLKIKILTRPSDSGKFTEQWNVTHKVKGCCFGKTPIGNKCFTPKPIHPEQRELVVVSNDPETVKKYFVRQDLFEITGPFTLQRWVRTASATDVSLTVFEENKNSCVNEYAGLRIYDYQLSK
jgi:hypothetical protein